MVLREGVETVLILGAVSLNSTELLSFLGTLVGVIVAILFGVMFVKGSVRINLQKFFRVTTVILIFRGGPVDHLRAARALGKRRAALFPRRDGPDRTHRPQRFVLLCHHRCLGRADGACSR